MKKHITGHNKLDSGRALCGESVAPDDAVEFVFEAAAAHTCPYCLEIAGSIAGRIARSVVGQPTRYCARRP